MPVFQEEIFGPVVSVTTFTDFDDAMTIANDTLHGLGAGVWTRDGNTRLSRGPRDPGRSRALLWDLFEKEPHVRLERVTASAAVLELLASLEVEHGPLMFHQSGGCCDGSSPMCYSREECRVGSRDVHLGDLPAGADRRPGGRRGLSRAVFNRRPSRLWLLVSSRKPSSCG